MKRLTSPIASVALRLAGVVLLLLLAAACEPVAWLMSSPTISPAELEARIAQPMAPLVLDLRSPADFQRGHVPTARLVALGDVGSASRSISSEQLVVPVCKRGRMAALGIASTRGVNHYLASILDGGMDNWISQGKPIEISTRNQSRKCTDRVLSPPIVARGVAWVSGGVIKPTYMLLSLALILWLRRSKERDLRLLRTGLVAFLSGESACLLGYCFSSVKAPFQLLEWLHCIGMAVGMGLGLWGLFLAVDGRMLGMLAPEQACALNRFCGSCHKRQPVTCMPQWLMRAAVLLTLPLAGMPWTQELVVHEESASLFGVPVDYRWPVINQLFELRVFPTLALLLLVYAWLRFRPSASALPKGQWALFIGLGFLSFSLMRLLLIGTHDRWPYWADSWEEISELIGIVGTGVLLWAFRRQFGIQEPKLFRTQAGMSRPSAMG